MPKKRKSFIVTDAAILPTFGTGEASELLSIPIWRLQKFLDSRSYNLSPDGRLGTGQGSRRIFSKRDLHRVALATWLVRDGFAAQFVGSVVQQLDDNEIDVYIDHQGEEQAIGVAFYRGQDGPSVRVYQVGNTPAMGQNNSPFYSIDLDEVFAEVDRRIEKRAPLK